MTKTIALDIATAESELERCVVGWINSTATEYGNGVEGVARDLFTGGCASGIVGHLVYSRDSERFARAHIVDILAIWQSDADDLGTRCTPRDGVSLDLNWLAWYGFESSARRVLARVGVEC